MGKELLVSVILASYNHENYIIESIQSVLTQDIQKMELIVVDDASNDRTLVKVKEIKDPRLRIISFKENRRFHPRNEALNMARGKYIAFQNSDDVWKQDKLEKQIEILEKDPQLSGCFTGVEIIDKNNIILENNWANGLFTLQNRNSIEWLRHFFDQGNCLCISSALARSDQIRKVGNFNPSLIQLGDFDLWIRLAALGEFYIIEENLTKMRISDTNLSKPSPSSNRRSIMEYIDVLERYREDLIFDKMDKIFADIMPNSDDSEVAKLGALAIHAWDLSPAHIIFANRIIAEIIKHKVKKEKLLDIFGVGIIHDFLKKRGEIEINFGNREPMSLLEQSKYYIKLLYGKLI